MGLLSLLFPKNYQVVNQYQAIDVVTENKNVKLLDVRTVEEFRQGALKGATNIDIKDNSFLQKADTMGKNCVLIVYCRSGIRSAKACKLLSDNGFENVYNLKGGIGRWRGEYKL